MFLLLVAVVAAGLAFVRIEGAIDAAAVLLVFLCYFLLQPFQLAFSQL